MKPVLLIFVLMMSFFAGHGQSFEITGHFTGFPDSTLFELQDLDSQQILDSAMLLNNRLQLHGRLPDSPNNLWLSTTVGKDYFYVSLLMGNEHLVITGDKTQFPFDLSFSGSVIQQQAAAGMAEVKSLYKKRNAWAQQSFALTGDSAEARSARIWDSINILDQYTDSIRRQFVVTHANTFAGLQEMFFLRKEFSRDSLQHLLNAYTPAFRQNKFGQRIERFLKIGNPVKEEDHYADFAAQDSAKKIHHPSESSGRYILLDFSTTYCGPCVQSVSDLKKLYRKHQDSLTILTISGDIGRDTWLTGIRRDRPDWLSLWDGKGLYGETLLKYGVNGFPTFYLIDPRGIILHKWVGYGQKDNGTGTLLPAVEEAFTHSGNTVGK